MSDKLDLYRHERYPRSNTYDPDWVVENQMGPNALWLVESLTELITIEPGMRILDLGCGRAMTSIFLAKEFDAQVWATDLWIPASDNHERIKAAGVDGQVFPIHAEAHDLPYAAGFFDLIVSIDAYHYFGTDDLYIGTAASLLREGGRLAINVPGLTAEVGSDVPEHLVPFWDWEFGSFHSPAWWRNHWAKTGKVTVDAADLVPDGWKDWMRWEEFVVPRLDDGWMKDSGRSEIEMHRIDAGRTIGFTRVVATKV